MKTPHYLIEAYEEISASVFSSDIYEDSERRVELRERMERWERGLKAAEEFEKQFREELENTKPQ